MTPAAEARETRLREALVSAEKTLLAIAANVGGDAEDRNAATWAADAIRQALQAEEKT